MKASLLAVLLILSVGCQKDVSISQNACTAADPLQVPWVKDIITPMVHCSCLITFFQGTYNGQTVYFKLANDPLCDVVFSVTLLDCVGKTVKIYGSSLKEQQAFVDEVKIGKSLYICNH